MVLSNVTGQGIVEISPYHIFRFEPGACLSCCCFGGGCVIVTGLTGRPPAIGGDNTEDNNPDWPLALGFSGDKAPCRGALPIGMSPVTFRRTGGRADVEAEVDAPAVRTTSLSFSPSVNSLKGDVSPPKACRRDFSCLACTMRK